MQVDGARSKGDAGKLQASHPERQSHYSHQEAHKHGPQGANGCSRIAKYNASFIARSNEAFVDYRKPDVYQLRKRFYWSPTGFSRSWSGERCRFFEWLPEKPVQFSKYWREPHRAEVQWHAQVDRGLYPEFRERSVYKGLLDVPLRARVRHWR